MGYFVCEVQNNTMDTYFFDNKADADEKFYDILRYACKSSVAIHGAMIVGIHGERYEDKFYEHPQTVE